MFYNTIGATKIELSIYEDSTSKENRLVLEIFKEHKHECFTPHQIRAMLIDKTGHDHLIGNVRRAITDLTSNKELIKSDTACAKGIYTKPNHVWTLAI